MPEYSSIQLQAKKAGVSSWHVKSDENLIEELLTLGISVVKETEVPATEAPASKKVTFFWKNNRNEEFLIVVKEATQTTSRESRLFASTKSVLVLDESDPIEKKAIKHLRAKAAYKIDFDEIERRNAEVTDAGAKLDDLMALDHKVLAQMVGGAVQDFRKTKGELITELTAK